MILFSPGQVFTQELKKMQASIVPEEDASSIIVRDPNEAILIIYSTIANMSFDERNRGIISVDNPYQGVYHVHLHPGTNRVVFTAEGYLPLQVRYYIEKKNFKEARISVASEAEGESTGILVVMSTPTKATVYLDGMKMGQETTVQLRNAPVGPHEVTVEKDEYQAYTEKVEIKEDEVTTVSAILQPNFAPLTIRSDPAGARLFLNNSPRGVTPYNQDRQPAGEYTIRLIHPPYFHDLETRVTVERSLPVDLNLVLQQAFGSVLINSQPPGARIIANDLDDWGVTPITRDTVLSGSYSLHLEQELHAPFDTSFAVEDGKAVTIMANLIPAFGTAVIASEPAGMSVYVDGVRQLGVTPLTAQLGLGQHTVEIKDELYEDYSESIIVRVGDTETVSATMVRKRGTVQLFPNPPEAVIFVNGDSLGIAAQILRDYEIGEYIVEARLAGYQPLRQTITVEHGRTKVVELNLLETGGPEPLPTASLDLQLRFVSADGTPNRLEAGETGAIWVTVQNRSATLVRDLTVQVDARGIALPGLRLPGSSAIDTIPPNDQKQIRIPVEADLSTKNQDVQLVVSIHDENGVPLVAESVSFETIAVRPTTLTINSEIRVNDSQRGMAYGNSNGHFEPGEAAEFIVQVQNSGRVIMRDVVLTVSLVPNSKVYYLNKYNRFKLGQLPPGRRRNVAFGLAASRDYAGATIPVQLTVSDRTGLNRLERRVNIPVD